MNRLMLDKERLGLVLANTALLISLCDNKILKDDIYFNNSILNETMKKLLLKNGVNNGSMLQTIFYNLVIIPKDILNLKFNMKLEKEFYALNLKLGKLIVEGHSNFHYDDKHLKYMLHMDASLRNSNCNLVNVEGTEYLLFEHFNKKNYCFFKLKLADGLEIAKLMYSIVYYVYEMIE